jgi:hypothetical protein
MAHSMPLPGPSSPHVRRRGGRGRRVQASVTATGLVPNDVGRGGRGGSGGAVGDHDHLVGVDAEPGEQPLAGGLGHDDDGVGERARLFEHRSLAGGRRADDRVCASRTTGTTICAHEGEHGVAVGPVVDAVLVLDDDDVGGVECVDARPPGWSPMRSPIAAITSESSSAGARPHRTTSTVAPFATRPALSAAAKVAIPHAVGGNVDSMPNEPTFSVFRRAGGTGVLVVDMEKLLASVRRGDRLRRATDLDGRPAQARRTHPFGGYSERTCQVGPPFVVP